MEKFWPELEVVWSWWTKLSYQSELGSSGIDLRSGAAAKSLAIILSGVALPVLVFAVVWRITGMALDKTKWANYIGSSAKIKRSRCLQLKVFGKRF